MRRGAEKPLGDALRGRGARLAALAVGVAVVAIDVLVLEPWDDGPRLALGAGGALLLLALADLDARSLGLRLQPRRGVRYWVLAAFVAGGIVVAFAAVVSGGAYVLGIDMNTDPMFRDAAEIAPALESAVLWAPVVEEPIYRLAVCIPVIALLGRWPAIVVSGAVFGFLHFHYGNPGADNFIAGYLLGWAYVESRSIVVPIVFHALGNLCVVGGHAAYFLYHGTP